MIDPPPPVAEAKRAARSAGARRSALAGLGLSLAVFLALGTWQVERRAWKLDLIARVEQRIHADPVVPPAATLSPERLAADWEYRRVATAGRYTVGADTYVQAVTELGAGFWVLTPLSRADGDAVLVNRGFVAAQPARPAPSTPATVTGLVRLSEPGGGFLRRNDPAADRWFSRDVGAIAAARGVTGVAPYFIDAEAAADARSASADEPVGGLTVVRFANNHLVYAVTWYVLAALSAVAAVPLIRDERRSRTPRAAAPAR